MRILLVNPSCVYEEGRDLYSSSLLGSLFTLQPFKKMALGLPLALPTLAAHTPKEHIVTIVDEEIETINFNLPVDLVGITAMSFKAKRAYEISREFRKRGVKVIMGGIHASMCPEEALEYVDTVAIGEAEDIWEKILKDAENNKLQRTYSANGFPNLEKSKIPRYDLVKNRNYIYTYLQSTRGCPYNCSFCTVTKQNGRILRKKTPEQMIAEIDSVLSLNPSQTLPLFDERAGKLKMFAGTIAIIDDNFAIDRAHALAVCKALKEYQDKNNIVIMWYSQFNISTGLDEELLDALQEANCQFTFVGLESLNPDALKAMNKKMNSPESYKTAIDNIQKRGIRVIASLITGDEFTSWENAEYTNQFLKENNVFHLLINILTPYPGTEILEEMLKEKRILTRDPQKYNIRNVVFTPKAITKKYIEEIYAWLVEELFSFDQLYERGKGLLKYNKNFGFPWWFRLPIFFAYTFNFILLTIMGRINWRIALRTLPKLPFLFLKNGSFYAVEFISACVDWDEFAREEVARIRTELSKNP